MDTAARWNVVGMAVRIESEAGGGGTPLPADDFDLMERVAEGDPRAYRLLVERHLRKVHSLAFRLLGSRAEAEDVAQETFTRLWQGASGFVPRAKVSTWLYRIAHNLCIDRIRRRRESDQPALLDAVPASGRPSLHLHNKQRAEAVHTALDELPERQKVALTLTHYEGMSHAQAAEVIGVSVRALESLLARGRRALRESLAALVDDEGRGS
jgi:RNA polymerase sigma-70 factor (ECF subfamily)